MTAVDTKIACGACQTTNDPVAKFCTGCGHHLHEACPECSAQIGLTQKFCDHCGQNVANRMAARIAAGQAAMAQSLLDAKSHRYQQAIARLEPIIDQPDYRLGSLVKNAQTLASEIQQRRDRNQAVVNQRVSQAIAARGRQRHDEAFELLRGLPESLLEANARVLKGDVETFIAEVHSLEKQVAVSIKSKDWPSAGAILSRLLVLRPEHTASLRLASQVGDRIIRAVRTLIERDRFNAAVKYLSTLPEVCRNEETELLLRSATTHQWFGSQFQNQPMLTPTLRRLANRFKQQLPGSDAVSGLLTEVKAIAGQPAKDPRNPWRSWHRVSETKIGQDVQLMGRPAGIDWTKVDFPETAIGRVNVAIGLALTALGRGRIQETLYRPKIPLTDRLRRKKSTGCWGIDLGSSGIRAIRLQPRDDKTLEATDLLIKDFDISTDPLGDRHKMFRRFQAAVKQCVEALPIGDEPVWINIPTVDVVSHQIRLPPVSTKLAMKLLNDEASQRIPLSLQEVSLITWLGTKADSTSGPPGYQGSLCVLGRRWSMSLSWQ